MTVTAIIPARGGSKGIPRKNLIKFAGQPLLYWTVAQARASKLVDAVYVTSDSAEILDAAQGWGALPIERPTEIAGDAASSESALCHALDVLGCDPETIVFLQPTSPLRRAGDIDGAVNHFRTTNADSLFSGARLDDFIVWHRDGAGLNCVNHDWRARTRRQDRDGTSYVENGSIYVLKPSILRESLNRFGGRIEIYEMMLWQSFEVDDLEQLELCQILFNHYLGNGMCGK
jgi:CMP-N,N'-diacetyllegionaminic acid synthase